LSHICVVVGCRCPRKLFDFGDIDARVEEEGSGGGSEGVRAIQALLARGSIGTLDRMHVVRWLQTLLVSMTILVGAIAASALLTRWLLDLLASAIGWVLFGLLTTGSLLVALVWFLRGKGAQQWYTHGDARSDSVEKALRHSTQVLPRLLCIGCLTAGRSLVSIVGSHSEGVLIALMSLLLITLILTALRLDRSRREILQGRGETDIANYGAELTDQPERAQPAWSISIGAVARARLSLAFGVASVP
jgi:hypothetical protein